MRLFSDRATGAVANRDVGPRHPQQHARSCSLRDRPHLGGRQPFFERIWPLRFHAAPLTTEHTTKPPLPALEATSHYPTTHDEFECEQLDGKTVRTMTVMRFKNCGNQASVIFLII